MAGKGDKRRPQQVSDEHVASEWERIFPKNDDVLTLDALMEAKNKPVVHSASVMLISDRDMKLLKKSGQLPEYSTYRTQGLRR